MSNPIILTIDDEMQVLNAIERDLRKHYKSDYRIMKASSGLEALDTIKKLKQRNDQVALFLVEQRKIRLPLNKSSLNDFLSG